ncbi:carbohydrate-binding protein [Clostridium sp.]|uniref:carbohydrate-binding protein n=1 Tax=Clostridium sp. TaxID=1506 RepID=UPI003D6C799F
MEKNPIKELTIQILNKSNVIKSEVSGNTKISLTYEESYQQGDKIHFANVSENKYLVIRIDDELNESLVYLIGSTLEFAIPFNEQAKPYSDNTFKGKKHNMTMRLAKKEEVFAYRDLAENVMDKRGETTYYPHATANVETRNESIFAARNVIDGRTDTQSHGKWPYQSWGIGQKEDAQIIIDFGRKVEVDKIVLYLRADYPHDTYWNYVRVEFSDGSHKIVEPVRSCGAQCFKFNKKVITWIKLLNFKKAEENIDFAALTEIQVYGNDI